LKNDIAFFDFDGTITRKDTLLELIKLKHGKFNFYWGLFLNSPFLIAYKVGLIKNYIAKERILKFFFGSVPLNDFNELCDRFTIEVLPGIIRFKALQEIEKLQSTGVQIVIVSASAENWIKNWSDSINATLIATKMEVVNGKITGRILGNNCHGAEKVKLIEEMYDLSKYSMIFCYGDSAGDRPMLALGNTAFYKPFR
jgi:phosphatidylglycerophosphatase C